ncbi:MAG: hypothetical protein K0S32_2848 [Bacteroidetes bacterium]|jgi:hypothetical protein|nr:hypothetical protein [Bacteroidota bacterium]
MAKKRYDPTERIGVNHVENIFLDKFKWIFREQPIVDIGIDALVEIVNNGIPSGKLIGVQIKTGESHFKISKDKLVFYGKRVHFDYWLNHSLPVILVGHLPDTGETFWQVINKNTAIKTKKGWKVEMPVAHELNKYSINKLKEIQEGTKEQNKLNKLLFDKDLIRHIQKGEKIIVYTEEWLNKTLGRGPFKVIVNTNGKDVITREWMTFYLGGLENILTHYFPWANIEVDNDYYDVYFDDSVYSMFSDSVTENDFYPYEVQASEVAYYRLNLKLNELGKSFLKILDYIENP